VQYEDAGLFHDVLYLASGEGFRQPWSSSQDLQEMILNKKTIRASVRRSG
jgi:hypothetical protein